jgi:hypothetical protein
VPTDLPDEPLEASAPLARSLAARHCPTDGSATEGCGWYHGLWQDLRLMELAADPRYQAEFFRRALAEAAGGRVRPRVLVCGSADYSLLAHVLWAGQRSGFTPEVTVLDACETPLELNRWYAGRAGTTITTVRGDALTHVPDAPFDVICSHSFLGQFDSATRALIVDRWRDQLAPGGSAITAQRLRATTSDEKQYFSESRARAFCNRVREQAAALAGRMGTSPGELAAHAAVYARRLFAYPVSRDRLAALFETPGLKLARFDEVASPSSSATGSHGIGIPGNAVHGCIRAEKA